MKAKTIDDAFWKIVQMWPRSPTRETLEGILSEVYEAGRLDRQGATMKLCKDCKHCRAETFEFEKCLHPKTNNIDLVTGENKGQYCEFERKWDWLRTRFPPPAVCGKEGRWFEPKN